MLKSRRFGRSDLRFPCTALAVLAVALALEIRLSKGHLRYGCCVRGTDSVQAPTVQNDVDCARAALALVADV
jgi:hypothetical protein